MDEPPLLLEHLAVEPEPKKGWLTVRVLLAVTSLVAVLIAGAITALTRVPFEATIDFPMTQDEHLEQFLREKRVQAQLDRFSWNDVSTYRATPGWGIWASEAAILDDARNEGYFCIIRYSAAIPGYTWTKAVRQGECGHRRNLSKCTSCQSIIHE